MYLAPRSYDPYLWAPPDVIEDPSVSSTATTSPSPSLTHTPFQAPTASPSASNVLSQSKTPEIIAFSVLSFISILLCIPPLVIQIRNKIFPTTCLVVWCILINSMLFINSLIWWSTDQSTWFSGAGLCDIEVRLKVASGVATAGCLLAIFRSLAGAVDTNSVSSATTRRQRKVNLAIEIIFGAIFPIFTMTAYYLVQPRRYDILRMTGCAVAIAPTWLTLVLVVLWPTLFLLIALVYCVLILYRVFQHHLGVRKMFEKTQRQRQSRFYRLLILAVILLFLEVPFSLCTFVQNIKSITPMEPYSFAKFHGPEWNTVERVNSEHVSHDRWIQISMGFVLFLGLGLNKESRKLYRQWFSKLPTGRCFPNFLRGSDKSHNVSSTPNSSKHLSDISSATKLDKDIPPLRSIAVHAPDDKAQTRDEAATKPISKLRRLCSLIFASPFNAFKLSKRKQPLISPPLPSQCNLSTSTLDSSEFRKPPRPYRSLAHGEYFTTPPTRDDYFSFNRDGDFTIYSRNRDSSSLLPSSPGLSTNWYYQQQREAGYSDHGYGLTTNS